VPHTTCPACTIFEVSTPHPEPSTARVPMRALSPMPDLPAITA